MKRTIRNNGNYFLKDVAISNSDKDYFKHKDFADIIQHIIENNTAPFNVAIIGKWGIGKSSLIKFVENYFKNDKKKYIYHEINAWKYEKEALRKVFLKQIWLKLNERENGKQNKESAYKEFIHRISNIKIDLDYKRKTPKQKLQSVGIFLLEFFGLICIFLIAYIVIGYFSLKLSLGNQSVDIVWSSLGKEGGAAYYPIIDSIVNAFKGNSFTVFFSSAIITIFKELFGAIKYSAINQFNINQPLKTADDFEIELAEQLEQNKDLKIITVIDDLDRLSTSKIVEALDAIKAFVDFKNCIFLVPFDDEILRIALDKSKKQLNYNSDCEVIESELFLDKLFQFKIYLPPLIEQDMRDYAWNLCLEEVNDLIQLCGEELFKETLYSILIHSYVTTPRQVKKIINNFANNLIIACRREGEKIETELLLTEKGIKFLAKISVLQVDFNEFYDVLVKNYNAIEDFLLIYNMKQEINQVNSVKRFFDKKGKLISRYQALGSFLQRTADINSESVEAFIYLAQDSFTRSAGDANSRTIVRSLRDGNVIPIKELLQEDREKYTGFIIHRVENTVIIDLINTLRVCFELADEVADDSKEEFAELISSKAVSVINNKISFTLNNFKLENMIKVYNRCKSKEGVEEFIKKLLYNRCNITDDVDKLNLSRDMQLLINNHAQNSEGLRDEVKKVIVNLIDEEIPNYSVLDYLIEDKEIRSNDIFETYYGIDFYKKLLNEVKSKEVFGNSSLQTIKDVLAINKSSVIMTELIVSLLELLEVDDLISKTINLLEPYYMLLSGDNSIECIMKLIHKYNENDTNKDIINGTLKLMEMTNWIDNVEDLDEEQMIEVDAFLLKAIKGYEINLILNKFSSNNKICLLEKTIGYINKSLLNGDENDNEFSSSIVTYSDKQLEDILTITNQFFRNPIREVEKIDRYCTVINILRKNKNADSMLATQIGQTITTIKSRYTTYPDWTMAVLHIIVEVMEALDENTEQIFMNILLDVILPNKVEMGFEIIASISNIPEKYRFNCVKAIVNQEDNIEINRLIKCLYKISLYSNKDINDVYSTFLVEKLASGKDNSIMIKELNRLGSVDKLECLIVKINDLSKDNQEEVLLLAEKLFRKANNKLEVVEKVLELTLQVDILARIIDDTIPNPKDEILLPLIQAIDDEMDDSMIYAILCLVTIYKEVIDKNIILTVLERCLQVSNDYYRDTLKVLNDSYTDYFRSKRSIKAELARQLFSLSSKCSSESAKKEIGKVVKVLGLQTQFSKLDQSA